MTREQVAERIREAWDTLRRVPAHGIPGYRSAWPEFVQDAWDAYGQAGPALRLEPASPRAIDEMNETFRWFRFVADRDLVRAMWLTCGCGMGPRRAGHILGCHRNTIRNRRDEALELILKGLARDVRFVPQSAAFAT